MSESVATKLAKLIGGKPMHTGGNIWCVLFVNRNGYTQLFETGAVHYKSKEDFENMRDWEDIDYGA